MQKMCAKYIAKTKILSLLSKLFKCQARCQARKPKLEGYAGITGLNLKDNPAE